MQTIWEYILDSFKPWDLFMKGNGGLIIAISMTAGYQEVAQNMAGIPKMVNGKGRD